MPRASKGLGLERIINLAPQGGVNMAMPNHRNQLDERQYGPQTPYNMDDWIRQMKQQKQQRTIFDSMIDPELIRGEYEGIEKALYPLLYDPRGSI
jgi:hypothetical protein